MTEDLDFDDDFYIWFVKPKNALLAIDLQNQESDVFIESNNDSEQLSEEEPIFTLSKDQLVDLTITCGPLFKPYVDLQNNMCTFIQTLQKDHPPTFK